MSLTILFHFLCAQHVSDINISIIKSSQLFCWITTLVVLFLVRCVLEIRCGWVGVVSVLQAEASACNTHRTKNNSINVVIQQNSRKLLMMDILMSETCWAHKKWNNIASDIKLVFYSSSVLHVWKRFRLNAILQIYTKNYLPLKSPLITTRLHEVRLKVYKCFEEDLDGINWKCTKYKPLCDLIRLFEIRVT